MSQTIIKSQPLLEMTGVFTRIAANLRGLGINLRLWDCSGRIAIKSKPFCEFCRTICMDRDVYIAEARDLIKRVASEGKPGISQLSTGCCAIATPVFRRRRIVGIAQGCFPPTEMLDEEFLSRLFNRFQLDRKVMTALAHDACRRSASQAEDFLRVLIWLMEAQQGVSVARKELETLSVNLASTYEELNLLYTISGSMKVTQRPEGFLQKVCDELVEVMGIQTAAAFIYAYPPAVEEDLLVISGGLDMKPKQIRHLAATYVSSKSEGSGRVILDNNFAGIGSDWAKIPIRNLVVVPLSADDGAIGILFGLNKITGDFDSVDLKLIGSIGNQAAVFLANHKLYSEQQDLLMGVLHALTASIDAKDPYTCGHSQRVAIISRRLAEEFGFAPEKVEQLYLAGILHDIGKIGVPEAVLSKKGRLTDDEYEAIKCHPRTSAKILSGIRQMDEIIPGVLTHHERPDGKGYPQGLKGQEVPIEGLIVGLADCFDAMTSHRTYRDAMPLEAVIEEIKRNTGTQFDKAVVDKLLSLDLEKFMQELYQPANTVYPITNF